MTELCAITLSRDFSTINDKTYQLQHKTLPPHIDFLQLKNDNILKPIHYLFKLPTQKNDSHLIIVVYGDDQFTLRIQIKGSIVKYTPLDSFSFQSVSSFLNKYKKPIKDKFKTSLQENPLLNEINLYENDDTVIEGIPKQDSQTSCELYTLLGEIQYHNFNDIHLSQDNLPNITNSSSSFTNATNINAKTQTPIKPTSTQSLPLFDPTFFAECKAFEMFFLSSDTLLTLPILLQAQKDDTVLSTVYKRLKKQRPHSLTPVTKANSFYTRTIDNSNTYILYIDPNSHLIQFYTLNSGIFEAIFIKTQPSINQTRKCLPFKLFYAAFNKTHSHGHSGEKLSIKTLTNSITFLIFLYGSQFSFMTVMNVKQIKIFLLNPKAFLLLYHFMKKPLFLITDYQCIPKAPSLLLPITIPIFSLLLMLLATLLLPILLLILHLNMLFKPFFIIG